MKVSPLHTKWRENISFIDLKRAIRLHFLKVNIFNLANQNNFHMHLPKFKETSWRGIWSINVDFWKKK